jgi:hypothetical protein
MYFLKTGSPAQLQWLRIFEPTDDQHRNCAAARCHLSCASIAYS